jgi:transmembrane sensor
MNTRDSASPGKPSAATRAEAAAWVARLHGPNRNARVEEACRRWMAEDPERAAAFELLTDTWEKAGQLNVPVDTREPRTAAGFRISFSRAALATVAIAVVAIAATALYLRPEGLATGVGEQRTLTLPDGTRVYLNTNSRAVVHFDRQVRRVELAKGEALFEVAHNPAWPFIVRAGPREVRALGTAFVVRNDPRQLAITLVEGSVRVSPQGAETAGTRPERKAAGSGKPTQAGAATEVLTLDPGERVTFASGHPARLDRPSLEKITAWRRGQISLDDTTLADTVSEINRYNVTHVVVRDPSVAAIRLSGVFRAGDTQNFVKAVTRTYHLRARNEGGEIFLEPSTAR